MNTRVIGQGDLSPRAHAGSARRYSRAFRSRAFAGGIAAVLMALPASYGLACGYENPVNVARGLLNWAYLDSLHVVGAISNEVAEKRLPASNFSQKAPDLFGRRYHATQKALVRFGDMLGAAPHEPIALVLVEPVLWTRFEQDEHGTRTRVHVAGPQPGELVLVSGEAVIGEIAAQRLMLVDAYTRGLVRLYGSEVQIGQFLVTYGQIGESGGAPDTPQKPILSTASVEDRP
ncbi:hypothetical protein [Rhizobium gallicum]|uniref:hypothetical protein n=1 Tax=Rhizobium gallicum TaxID=56730 RepID=UPI001EF8FC37|nr:hypothetical protein [Rhizobium gallicum]ULJ76063.1 hypothetical protein L2W42_26765 [Rhizobium gallicum]